MKTKIALAAALCTAMIAGSANAHDAPSEAGTYVYNSFVMASSESDARSQTHRHIHAHWWPNGLTLMYRGWAQCYNMGDMRWYCNVSYSLG